MDKRNKGFYLFLGAWWGWEKMKENAKSVWGVPGSTGSNNKLVNEPDNQKI